MVVIIKNKNINKIIDKLKECKLKELTEFKLKELDEIIETKHISTLTCSLRNVINYDCFVTKPPKYKLKEMSQNKLKPIYIEEFDTQYRLLKTAFNEMNNTQSNLAVARTKGVASEIEEAENNVIAAVKRFGEVENTFKNWYEKTHYNKYQSIRTGYDTKSNKVPKSFNFERLPASTVADK